MSKPTRQDRALVLTPNKDHPYPPIYTEYPVLERSEAGFVKLGTPEYSFWVNKDSVTFLDWVEAPNEA